MSRKPEPTTLREAVAECCDFQVSTRTCRRGQGPCRVLTRCPCVWFERGVLPQCGQALQDAYRKAQDAPQSTRTRRHGNMVTGTLFEEDER